MNEPTKQLLVCMKDGKYLAEENDGQSTMTFWVDSVLRAKVYSPTYCYNEPYESKGPIKVPAYYQKWPEIPAGAVMALVAVDCSVTPIKVGPEQTSRSQLEIYPSY